MTSKFAPCHPRSGASHQDSNRALRTDSRVPRPRQWQRARHRCRRRCLAITILHGGPDLAAHSHAAAGRHHVLQGCLEIRNVNTPAHRPAVVVLDSGGRNILYFDIFLYTNQHPDGRHHPRAAYQGRWPSQTIQMIQEIADGASCRAGQIGGRFGVSQPTYLAITENPADAGVLVCRESGQHRTHFREPAAHPRSGASFCPGQ